MTFSPGKTWLGLAALVVAGLVLPLWPLCVLAVLIAGTMGYSATALLLALFVDLLWGAPPGALHILSFPCTILALCAVSAHWFARRFMIGKSLPKTLY